MRLASRLRASLSGSEIAKVKALALRRGIWYRVLTRLERACMDLSAKVVDRVRSRLLADALNSILCKLCEAMESRIVRVAREVGLPLARRLSALAQEWGNRSAVSWTTDPGFVRFLTIGYVNAD